MDNTAPPDAEVAAKRALRQAEIDLNESVTGAFNRALEEGQMTKTQLAGKMRVSESSVDRYLLRGWSLGGIRALAVATGQHPARMLGREDLP